MGIAIHFNSDGTFFVDNAAKASTVRENKGHSKAIVLQDFTALDLETTGLSPEYDKIIELAAIRYRGGEPVATYEQLVNPGVEIDEFITELTGITNEEKVQVRNGYDKKAGESQPRWQI